MRLIDADAIPEVSADPYEEAAFRDTIEAMPTIEPEKGKWETKFMPTECNPFGDYPVLIMRCSACKTKITLMHEDENIKEKWHYCPNCGARMERANE